MAACNPENLLSSQLWIYRPDIFVFDQSGVRNNWAMGSIDMAAAPSPAPSLSSPSPPPSGRTHSRLSSSAVASPSAVCCSAAPPTTTAAPPPTTLASVSSKARRRCRTSSSSRCMRSRTTSGADRFWICFDLVRRLRVQQRIQSSEFANGSDENEMPDITSTIPFLPHMTPNTLRKLYLTSFSMAAGIIIFVGLLAPAVHFYISSGMRCWSHFAQFTTAVVNKDPKKSKYSDTLHRFVKKEHDWGWKNFMELSKVSEGFINADTLVIKAQVQVVRAQLKILWNESSYNWSPSE